MYITIPIMKITLLIRYLDRISTICSSYAYNVILVPQISFNYVHHSHKLRSIFICLNIFTLFFDAVKMSKKLTHTAFPFCFLMSCRLHSYTATGFVLKSTLFHFIRIISFLKILQVAPTETQISDVTKS
jgi:hypothetical protein